ELHANRRVEIRRRLVAIRRRRRRERLEDLLVVDGLYGFGRFETQRDRPLAHGCGSARSGCAGVAASTFDVNSETPSATACTDAASVSIDSWSFAIRSSVVIGF